MYQHFIAHGTAPSRAELASATAVDAERVQESLERLESARAIALTPNTRGIWMAHPFSAVPTPYPVQTSERTYWANCAWDALAIPPLIESPAEMVTSCPDCAEPIAVRVHDGHASPAKCVVHFVVPPRRFWDNVGFT